MATALSALRQGLSEQISDWLTVNTTDNIAADNDVVSTSLDEYADDTFNDWYVLIKGTTNDGVKRRIEDFTGSTGTILVHGAALVAETAAVAIEIHRIDPDDKKRALNEARLELYPSLYHEQSDWFVTSHPSQTEYAIPSTINDVQQVFLGDWPSLSTTGQLLTDGGFEAWDDSTTLTNWTATNITLAQETDTNFVLEGTYAARCTVTASSVGTLYETITGHAGYAGQRVSLAMRIYCETASRVTANVYDGTTTTKSSTHRGTGWEWLTVSYNMPASPSEMSFGLGISSGTAITCYPGLAIAWVGRKAISISRRPLHHWKQFGSTLYFEYIPPEDRPIELKGLAYLSSVSADTDEMEVDAREAELLYAQAAVYLYRQLKNKAVAKSKDMYDALLWDWENKKTARRRSHGMIPPPLQKGPPDA